PIIQKPYQFVEPDVCPHCERKAKFDLIMSHCTYVDTQKVRIQEAPEGLRGGQQAQSIDVDITDDLVAQVLPGDRVTINGILRPVQKISYGQKSPLFDLYLEANSLEIGEKEFEDVAVSEEDETQILTLAKDPEVYEKMVASIAPTVYGHEKVKSALLLALFGGVPKPMTGADLRGNIHVLILGDPGIAKSVILRYAVNVAPHGVFTTGKTSTGAGLTAAAVKDDFGDGRWTLEAGALVLADGGVCGVDELDKMRKEDRDALHEALEQQSISISKAGITTTLRSRCSLLAAANPKRGRFNVMDPIADQIDLPPSLISRFDLIFLIADIPNEASDARISDHILRTQRAGQAKVRQAHRVADETDLLILQEASNVEPLIAPATLRKYIAYARRFIFPALTPEADAKLREFYQEMRRKASSDPDSPVPVTARQLEALVRLAEASARIRLSDKITAADATRVTDLTLSSLRQICTDDDGNIDVDLMMSGQGKGSRDLVTVMKAVLKQNEGPMKIDTLIETMIAQKFRGDRVERAIEELTQSGELMQPRPNVTVQLM
ncbi:MAG: minichromosome maintenance protein MCM, partial [Bacilli bacterium]